MEGLHHEDKENSGTKMPGHVAALPESVCWKCPGWLQGIGVEAQVNTFRIG